VNFVVPQDVGGGLDFFDQGQIPKAKTKATVWPRPAYCRPKDKDKPTKFGLKAKAKD